MRDILYLFIGIHILVKGSIDLDMIEEVSSKGI